MSEVQDQVKKIVVDHLGIDESKVNPEAKFIDDLGADSLDTVELVMAFEEKFGIEIFYFFNSRFSFKKIIPSFIFSTTNWR